MTQIDRPKYLDFNISPEKRKEILAGMDNDEGRSARSIAINLGKSECQVYKCLVRMEYDREVYQTRTRRVGRLAPRCFWRIGDKGTQIVEETKTMYPKKAGIDWGLLNECLDSLGSTRSTGESNVSA